MSYKEMVEGHLAFPEYSQRLASSNKLVRGKMCNIKHKTHIFIVLFTRLERGNTKIVAQ